MGFQVKILFKVTESIPIFNSPGSRKGRQVRKWQFPSMAGLPQRTQSHLRGSMALWAINIGFRARSIWLQISAQPFTNGQVTYAMASVSSSVK